jgi:hypothetical protein
MQCNNIYSFVKCSFCMLESLWLVFLSTHLVHVTFWMLANCMSAWSLYIKLLMILNVFRLNTGLLYIWRGRKKLRINYWRLSSAGQQATPTDNWQHSFIKQPSSIASPVGLHFMYLKNKNLILGLSLSNSGVLSQFLLSHFTVYMIPKPCVIKKEQTNLIVYVQI